VAIIKIGTRGPASCLAASTTLTAEFHLPYKCSPCMIDKGKGGTTVLKIYSRKKRKQHISREFGSCEHKNDGGENSYGRATRLQSTRGEKIPSTSKESGAIESLSHDSQQTTSDNGSVRRQKTPTR